MRNGAHKDDSFDIENLLLLHPKNLIFISKSFRSDLPGIFMEVNDTAVKTLGYSKDEFQSMTFFDLISPENVPLLEQKRRKLMDDSFVEYSMICFTKNRKKVNLHIKNYLFFSDTDVIEFVVAQEEDIVRKKSERKQELESKIETKTDLAVFENNGLAALLVNSSLSIIHVNSVFLEMSKVSRSTAISMNLFDFVKKDYLRGEFSKSIITEKDESVFPLNIKGVLLCKNNDHRYVQMNVGLHQNEHYVISFIDQTKRELLQNALSTSEKKYRELVQNAHDMLFLYPISAEGVRGKLLEVNKVACEKLGYSRKELLEKEISEITLRSDKDKISTADILEITKAELISTGKTTREGFLITSFGNHIPTEFKASIFTIDNERVILTIARDITERRKAEQALRESEEKYSTVVESSNDGIGISQDSIIVYANSQLAEMLEYSIEDLTGKKLSKILSKQDQDRITGYAKRRLNGDLTVPNKYEATLITSKGKEIPVESNVSVIEYMDATAELTILRDISERKEAEQALKESEEKYRLLFDNAQDMIFLLSREGEQSLDSKIFVDLNKEAINVLGYSKEEIVQKPIKEILSEETRSMFYDFSKELDEKQQSEGEVSFIRKDGQVIVVHIRAVEIELGGKKHSLSIARDITEKKKLEESIKKSERKFRELFQNAGEMIFLYELSDTGERSNFIDVNIPVIEKLGYSKEELLKMNLNSIVKEKYNEQLQGYSKEILKHKERMIKDGSTRTTEDTGNLITKSGKLLPIEYTSSYFISENKLLIQTIVRDISERQEAELALKESEEKYSTVVESSNDGIAITQDNIIVFANNKLAEMLEYALENLIGINAVKLVSIEHKDLILDYSQRRLEGDLSVPDRYEVNLISSKGKLIPCESHVSLIEYRNKPATLNILRDISEHQIAEQALRESEENFRSIVESSPFGIHMYELMEDGELHFIGANTSADLILGIDNRRFFGKKIKEALPNLILDEYYEKCLLTVKEGLSWNIDQVVYHHGDISGIFNINIFQTSPNKMVAAFQDVTERKLMEEQIRASEQRYRNLFQRAGDMIFIYELSETGERSSFIDVNALACDKLGYSKEELMKMNLNDIVREQYVGRLNDFAKEIIQRKEQMRIDESSTGEYNVGEFITKSGDVFPIEYTATLSTKENKIIVQTIVRDTSERLKAEKEIRESEEKFRHLFNNLFEMIYVISQAPGESAGKLIEVNEQACNTLGYSREEMLQMKQMDLIAKESHDDLLAFFEQANEKKHQTGELVLQTKSGNKISVEFSLTSFMMNENEITLIVSRELAQE